MVIAVLVVVVEPVRRNRIENPIPPNRLGHNYEHCYHHPPTVKPEAASAVVELLMMSVRMPEIC
jgi:hypothetical protein